MYLKITTAIKKCGRILKACCIYFIIDITRTILIPVVSTPQWKKKRIIQIQNGKKNDAILFTVNFIVSPIVDWIGFEIFFECIIHPPKTIQTIPHHPNKNCKYFFLVIKKNQNQNKIKQNQKSFLIFSNHFFRISIHTKSGHLTCCFLVR